MNFVVLEPPAKVSPLNLGMLYMLGFSIPRKFSPSKVSLYAVVYVPPPPKKTTGYPPSLKIVLISLIGT